MRTTRNASCAGHAGPLLIWLPGCAEVTREAVAFLGG